MIAEVHLGDCLDVSQRIPDSVIDLVYLDPPFFTQTTQRLGTRDRKREFRFSDVWKSADAYAEFLFSRLREFRRILAPTGSLFLHCDTNASHIARLLLDELFGNDMFRAEIIWHYKRWSNSQRTLLPSHQNIYFYSKTDNYKFNHVLQEYSSATNVDQILQKRRRDAFGKAVYARDKGGTPLSNGDKRGVPMNDVWDIPFLNPKAKERVGYPTQKPILLLERIIQISTDEGDSVLDPFCGSGTTLVAAELLNRRGIGIDTSSEAVEITKTRLENPIKTDSHLLQAGRESYRKVDEDALAMIKGLDVVPVHRNSGIDAFLKSGTDEGPIPIRVQRPNETLVDAAHSLLKASSSKSVFTMILVRTATDLGLEISSLFPEIIIVDSPSIEISKALEKLKNARSLSQTAVAGQPG